MEFARAAALEWGIEQLAGKEEMNMDERVLDIMDLVCAPEVTDDLKDIEFDDAGDEKIEQDFIEGWLREERAYNERIRVAEEPKETEETI
jgi:hypothetical protein